MNATIEKFGYPQTVVADYQSWVVLLRPKQITAGCLILACKEDVTSLPDVSPRAYAELKHVTQDIEHTLQRCVAYERINYLALMMVDPHVHFHVIPRHGAARELAGVTFEDAGWPKIPAFDSGADIEDGKFQEIVSHLRERWSRSA